MATLMEFGTIAPIMTPAPTGKTYLARDPEQWDWRDLRDYVVDGIRCRFGDEHARLPDLERVSQAIRQASVFKSFMKRWGADAIPISRYLIETCDGVWEGHPVTLSNWCQQSDPFVAKPVASRLHRVL